jgi:hypothetical protein
MRDDFPEGVKRELSGRAGHVCSNPACKQPTSGPSESDKTVTNVGVAAHITAAAPGGARYDVTLTADERRSRDNGIWLCQRCAKAVDDDSSSYTSATLRNWRSQAEESARRDIEQGGSRRVAPVIQAAVYLDPNAVHASGPNAIVLGPNAVSISGPVVSSSNNSPERRLDGPDPDGLYRIDGREICPECRINKGLIYHLQRLSSGGSAYGDAFGNMTYVEPEPTNEWECSVCGTIYTQADAPRP